MRELILDASVLAKWFHSEGEADLGAALQLMAEFESGELAVVVPPLLYLELLNIAKKRWAPTELQLITYAQRLLRLAFTVQQPDLENVARWSARGLTAYDACYVALAEERKVTVVTADRQMLAVGGPLCIALA